MMGGKDDTDSTAVARASERAPSEGWKSLRDVPDVNRLLRSLYGGSVAVSEAPSLRSSKRGSSARGSSASVLVPRDNLPPFGSSRSGSTKASSVAPVRAPRVGRVPQGPPSKYGDDIEGRETGTGNSWGLVARRRTKKAIDAELQYNSFRIQSYRPPHIKPVSTDQEKTRVAEKFTFGGGKALPDELTIPKAPIPSEVREAARESRRVEAILARRNGEESPIPVSMGGEGSQCPGEGTTALLHQIEQEILERQGYIREARSDGLSLPNEERILGEISLRIAELNKLGGGGEMS